ncbi:MAG TPA: OB-fold nucleic acid binding domain-containing protein [Thermoanaerobaculia bacterium]|nr:OB-fold nucleic acid binding domain-containing protein [Thermoanaerobaculia bacterium]
MLHLLLLLAALSSTTPDTIPIAVARQQATGSTVTVLGRVTVPSGRFSSSSLDQGFAIQDQTGGIYVAMKNDLRLKLDQHVVVTGTLAVENGELQIAAANVQKGGALRIATGRVGAATLGFIITVEGTITSVTPDAQYGTKVFIDDGTGSVQIYVNKSTNIDLAPLQPGRTIRVTGFASQYDSTYEIEPRSRADVSVVAPRAAGRR